MKRSSFRKTKIHDDRDNQDRHSEDCQHGDKDDGNHLRRNVAVRLSVIGVGFVVVYCEIEMPFLFFPDRLLYFALRR